MAVVSHSRVRSYPDWTRRLKEVIPGTKTHSRALSTTGIGSGAADPRSRSAPSLGDMAATLAPAPVTTSAYHLPHDIASSSAFRDPNTDSTVATDSAAAAAVSPVPDAGSEVTALSNKLIAAINHQTSLDDSLAATRLELQRCRDELHRLEAANREHERLLADGTLVRRAEIEAENARLRETAEEESERRAVVEKERKNIEQELENLTTALFEEANQMVAAARHERDLTERKNEQLRAQLKDTENLLASHQEQLVELKTVMQQMGSDRDETETNTNHSTAPTTPLLGTNDHLNKLFDALHLCPSTPGSDDIPPSYPTSFTHLLQPALRTDLPAFNDFTALLKTSRATPLRNRSSTGPYGGLSLVGLAGLRDGSAWNGSASSPSTTGSSPSAPSSGTLHSSPGTPITPSSSTSTSLSQSNLSVKDVVPLKETRFYKRVLVEDIEPTLRLDLAPGLSWLARRTIVASMSEGHLVVEPLPALPSIRVVTCALCGERRRGDEHARTHQLKANDHETAQRYPLCKYCTNRVRATCDILGFMRMVKDGHWRAEGDEAEKAAWEESVRLRDRMFWARIGGGVVPAFVQSKSSPRPSSAERDTPQKMQAAAAAAAESSESVGVGVSVGVANAPQAKQRGGEQEKLKEEDEEEDVFHSNEKRVSIGGAVICVEPDRDDPIREIRNRDQDLDRDLDRNRDRDRGDSTKEIAEAAAVESRIEEIAPGRKSREQQQEEMTSGRMQQQMDDIPDVLESSTTHRVDHQLSITIPGAFD